MSGNGVALTAINASNVTSGTLDNARTTAASANGASTIVARDSNGSFAGNVITGTTGTFTNISGNGVALTAINASNIASGTIDNARTTANSSNSASTIVLRDSNGSFAGNVMSASYFSGDGSNLTAINATSITTGTLATGRLTGSYTGITGVGTLTVGTWNANTIANIYTTANSANGASTIVARDTNGSFSANVGTFTTITGNHTSGSWTGSVVGAQYGGTGSANLTADNVILGNGANTVKVVAPGTANNVLTSNGTSWVSQAPTGGGGGSNITTNGLWENANTISADYTIGTNNNAQSAGPITINTSVTVTVPTGSTWVIV